MKTFEHNFLFGGRVTVLITEAFEATVNTAKEGFFKGLSTVICTGRADEATDKPVGKIIYTPSLSRHDRRVFHDVIVAGLEKLGTEGYSLKSSLDSIIAELRSQGVLAEAINLAD